MEPDSNGRRHIYEAEEHGAVDVQLSDLIEQGRLLIYPEVTGKGYFNIYSKHDQLVFQAGGYVGLIAINDRVAIDVLPRVKISRNLERIVIASQHLPSVLTPYRRRYLRHQAPNPSLLDLMADALLDALNEVVVHGLHREYQQRVADTSFPRGRVLIDRTIKRFASRDIYHVVAASWFEQSADTAVNRCLKYAIWYLVHQYGSRPPRKGTMKRISSLNHVYSLFSEVQLDHSLLFLDDRMILDTSRLPSIHAHCQDSVNLATTIIRNQGVAFGGRGTDVLMTALVISMDDVYERYLRTILRPSVSTHSPKLTVLDGNVRGAGGGRKSLFDLPPSGDATPDIVIRNEDRVDEVGEYPVIIDAKYKKGMPDRSDVNQAIAYGVCYRSSNIVISHPMAEGAKHGLSELGRIGEMCFYLYAFDLGAEDLDAEEHMFVKEMLYLTRVAVV